MTDRKKKRGKIHGADEVENLQLAHTFEDDEIWNPQAYLSLPYNTDKCDA